MKVETPPTIAANSHHLQLQIKTKGIKKIKEISKFKKLAKKAKWKNWFPIQAKMIYRASIIAVMAIDLILIEFLE
ncbi:MAG: hypothetical protein K2J69_00195 [Malacoplasma sp.]|nr:hypothetical protein [Malacoplasma sp.]